MTIGVRFVSSSSSYEISVLNSYMPSASVVGTPTTTAEKTMQGLSQALNGGEDALGAFLRSCANDGSIVPASFETAFPTWLDGETVIEFGDAAITIDAVALEGEDAVLTDVLKDIAAAVLDFL